MENCFGGITPNRVEGSGACGSSTEARYNRASRAATLGTFRSRTRQPPKSLGSGRTGTSPIPIIPGVMSSLRLSFRLYRATLKWGTSNVSQYKTSAAVVPQGHGQSLIGVQGADRFPQDPVPMNQNGSKSRPPVSITDTFAAVAQFTAPYHSHQSVDIKRVRA